MTKLTLLGAVNDHFRIHRESWRIVEWRFSILVRVLLSSYSERTCGLLNSKSSDFLIDEAAKISAFQFKQPGRILYDD